MNKSSSTAGLAGIIRADLHRYSHGEKLPSNRELMRQHRVSPVTVSGAIAALVAEGLVESRPGSGVFRAEPRPAPAATGDLSWQEVALSADPGARSVGAAGVLAMLTAPPAEVIDLNSGYLHPSLQPERALSAALARAGRRPDAWAKPPSEGLADLRAWFAKDIGGDGGTLSASDILITAGGQSALTTALRALAVPGAPVLVESPTYPGILAVARAAGLRPIPVPVDDEGIRTDLLAEAFRSTAARLMVCQPLFQNPTGAVLSPARRREVLRTARAAGAFVVEDDFARGLAHPDAPALPPPLAADDPDGTVVHIHSLTKPASPSLRVAALSARGPAWERLRATQVVDAFFVARPLQEAALELVASPAWRSHLRHLSVALHDRRQAVAAELLRLEPDLMPGRLPRGGYHLWLRLPDGTDETALVAAAHRAGVAVSPGRSYFPAESPAPHLRISYVGAPGTTHLTEAVRRLHRARGGTPGTTR
jgi:DNA-binding transcriptional MocR family regulator